MVPMETETETAAPMPSAGAPDQPKAGRASAMPAEERRAAIAAATLPLLLAGGPAVTTRQIAEAAGIAEGTIFRVFADKEAVVHAAVELALDTAATERALAGIEASLPFEEQLVAAVEIVQRRLADLCRLMAQGNLPPAGPDEVSKPPPDLAALDALFERHRDRVRRDPATAARQLRALTLAVSHPALYADEPLSPHEVVSLLLDGIRTRPQGSDASVGGPSC